MGDDFESNLNFSHLLIGGLIKGLKTDQWFFAILRKEISNVSEMFIENYKGNILKIFETFFTC